MQHTPLHHLPRSRAMISLFLIGYLSIANPAFSQANNVDVSSGSSQSTTAIQHLIVLIGENRTFDHVFATYVPHNGESVSNLLSKGIINADGSPGPHFSKAAQYQAIGPYETKYFISLDKEQKVPYPTLPLPSLNFSPTKPVFPPGTPLSFLAAVDLPWTPTI